MNAEFLDLMATAAGLIVGTVLYIKVRGLV